LTGRRRDVIFEEFYRETLARGLSYWWRPRGLSMAPAIHDGDRVLVAPASPESLRSGEIVKFRIEGAFVMHRLVRRSRRQDGALTFVFRGDNAPHDDPPVTAEAIIGRAVAVERDGHRRRLDSGFELWRGRLRIFRRSLIALWHDRRSSARLVIAALAALLSLCASAGPAHSNDNRDDDSRASKDSKGKIPTLSVVGTPRVGRHPLGVAIDSARGIAVVANRHDRTVSIVDLLSATTRSTMTVGRGPVDVAIHSSGIAFVTLSQENAIAVIDPALGTLIRKIPVGHHPSGIAVGGNVAVVVNEGSRSITILNAVSLTPIADLTVGRRPKDVAINPLTGVVAVTDQNDGTVILADISDPESPVFLPPVTLPGGGRGRDDDDRRRGPRSRPVGIAFDYGPSINQIVVADENRNAVHIIKLTGRNTVDSIRSVDVGKRPYAIAVNPGRDWALVTSEKDDVFGFTPSSGEVTGQADVGKRPRGVAIDPETCRAVVSNSRSHSVSVLTGPCNVLKIFSLSPSTAKVGSPAFTLEIAGSGFAANAVVNFGTLALTPTAVTPGRIQVTVPAPAVATTGGLLVTVTNPADHAGNPPTVSNTLPFVVNTDPLKLSTVTPNASVADGLDLALTITGQRIKAGARVFFGPPSSSGCGQEIEAETLTVPMTTVLHAVVPGIRADVFGIHGTDLTLRGGAYCVQVVNPDGERSNTLPVTIVNPQPTLSNLFPSAADQGSPTITMLLNGGGFIGTIAGAQILPGTVVKFNNVPVTAMPNQVQPTVQMVITIPGTLLTSAGVYTVSVENPAINGIGGGVASTTFTVRALSSILPTKVIAIPDGQQGHVTMVGDRLGAAAISNQGVVRLLDLSRINFATTTADAGVVLDPPIVLAAPRDGATGDIDGDPAAGVLAVALQRDDAVAVVTVRGVDPATYAPCPCTRTLALGLGSSPYGVALDVAHDRLLVVNQGLPPDEPTMPVGYPGMLPSLSVIRLSSLTEVARIPLYQAFDPNGLLFFAPALVAIDAGLDLAVVMDQGDPYGTNEGGAIVVNLVTQAIVGRYKAGTAYFTSGVAVDPVRHLAFVSNALGDPNQTPAAGAPYLGSLTRINLGNLGQAPLNVTTDEYPSGVAVDPGTVTSKHSAIVVNTQSNDLTAVNVDNPALKTTLPFAASGGNLALDIAWQPDAVLGLVLTGSAIPAELGGNNAFVIGVSPARLP
jgi:DNA-binding beta-propeller fold protein YncE